MLDRLNLLHPFHVRLVDASPAAVRRLRCRPTITSVVVVLDGVRELRRRPLRKYRVHAHTHSMHKELTAASQVHA